MINCRHIIRWALKVDYLGSDDHLVSYTAKFHPFADEGFRGLVLVVVRSVDEVAAGFVERIEELEAGLLVHRAHSKIGPFVTDTHRSEADGRNVNASGGRKLAVASELRSRKGRRGPDFCCRHDDGK